uniref:E3 ubiquitin-protein ligase n=1 Tax=Schizaphis graminum TaxID=13262 RepID=A0A2S2NKX0_SCHGA
MNPDNRNVCRFYLRKSCRFGDKCFNRHEKPSYSKLDEDELSVLTFEVASSSKHQQTHKNIPKTLTNEPIAHAPLNSSQNAKQKKKKKSSNKPPAQDLFELISENKNLAEKVNMLETLVSSLHEQFKEQEKENAKLINELNSMQLYDEDYKCPVCFEVFITPTLLNCSHMFCEWCIYKLLEQNDQCPICRGRIIDYTYCSNAGNIINRMIERMPYEVKMKFNKLKASRDEDKPKSLLLRAEREQLELIRITLNGYISS